VVEDWSTTIGLLMGFIGVTSGRRLMTIWTKRQAWMSLGPLALGDGATGDMALGD
jgi:hypothetical protein